MLKAGELLKIRILEILDNNSWAGSSQILIDPLFNPIKEEKEFKKFVDTYDRRMEREVRHYEELKDLPFSEFLQRIDEPLPQYTDLLD
jgi:hypothetical protein